MKKYVIKWQNKISKETGYVGRISASDRCFYPSDFDGAKRYKTRSVAFRMLHSLHVYGEDEKNEFTVEEADS